MNRLYECAKRLDAAARDAVAIPQLTRDWPELTVAEAYDIQRRCITLRLGRGERRVGMKMGLTSRAKMAQVGVDQLSWGRLTDAMLAEEGGSLPFGRFIHPRVEPEVAFLIARPLAGNVTPVAALAAVEAIAPAIEIIDSRYENFKFSLADVAADNSSSSAFVVGSWVSPKLDFSNLGTLLSLDGQVREIGSTAAILGHPVRSLVAAARMAAEAGEPLGPGDIVMAGGITAASPVAAGTFARCEIQNLGSATIHFERTDDARD